MPECVIEISNSKPTMGREFDRRSTGCEFDTGISTYTFMETDHEKFSTVILLLLLIQEVVRASKSIGSAVAQW